jgi:hypothetical protein
MKPRYALSEIQKNGFDRAWWRKRFFTHVLSHYFAKVKKPDSDPVTGMEWDNLIILDACRYDLFREVYEENPIEGDLQSRRSVESGTPGFLSETFANDTFHDIVYVTGNPYVNTELPSGTFHAVESVWQDGWDDELQTVHPKKMAERTLEIAKQYRHKRIISHFLQPHVPFVGDIRLGQRGTFAIRERALGEDDARTRHRTPFELLNLGAVTREEVWNAYRSNLEFAWPAVERLLSELPGLTAVTSDHGNGMGERAWPFPIRVYGHPLGILLPALTQVPWLTHTVKPRKDINSERPISDTGTSAEPTSEQLRMLGYIS